nr:acyl-CoA dehydrogenase family protein [Sporichthya sp.]
MRRWSPPAEWPTHARARSRWHGDLPRPRRRAGRHRRRARSDAKWCTYGPLSPRQHKFLESTFSIERRLHCSTFKSRKEEGRAYIGTQLQGGYGFITETATTRHYQDARILTVGEGTSEVQKMLIARARPPGLMGPGSTDAGS